MRKLLRAFFLASGLLVASLPAIGPVQASQSSCTLPSSGPMSMATFVGTYANPCLAAIVSQWSGTGSPSSPTTYQLWFNTTASPPQWEIYDGSQWIAWGYLNSSTHAFGFLLPATFNANSATPPTALTGTVVDVVGADSTGAYETIDTFGTNSAFIGRQSGGTNASKTALTNGTLITRFAGTGYDGSAYASPTTASMSIVADGNWSGTNHGTDLDFYCTPNSSVSSQVCATLTGGVFNLASGVAFQENGVTYTFPGTADTLAGLSKQDQSLSGGANVTPYNPTAGNYTVDCGKSPLQWIANTAGFTLTAPANDGSCVLQIENGSGAGTVTFSGFTEGTNTGDPLDTTNGHKFQLSIVRIHSISHYLVSALQ